MICLNCKKEISENSEFCGYCGYGMRKRSTHNYLYFFKKNSSKLMTCFAIIFVIVLIAWAYSDNEVSTYQEKDSAYEISTSLNTGTRGSKDIKKEYNSLTNGTIINWLPRYFNGLGELRIDNGTRQDAVVKLVKKSIDSSIYTAYIKSDNIHIIKNIPDGRYTLVFMHGEDWSESSKTFLVARSYSEFEEDFYYTTKEVTEYDGIYEEYNTYEITLHSVYGGTADIDPISANEFNKY